MNPHPWTQNLGPGRTTYLSLSCRQDISDLWQRIAEDKFTLEHYNARQTIHGHLLEVFFLLNDTEKLVHSQNNDYARKGHQGRKKKRLSWKLNFISNFNVMNIGTNVCSNLLVDNAGNIFMMLTEVFHLTAQVCMIHWPALTVKCVNIRHENQFIYTYRIKCYGG